jgi:ribosomal protein S27AE
MNSKYYDVALENFERAKRRCERAGLTAEWAKIVSRVRASHQRQMGSVSGFENLVAGSGPSGAPSFLERAKTNWAGRCT